MTNEVQTQMQFEKIIKNLTAIRRKKNADYGNAFMKVYSKYGKQSLFFDLLRKWQRLDNLLLTDKKSEVEDETVQDTLGDLAVMCINGMIWLNSERIKEDENNRK